MGSEIEWYGKTLDPDLKYVELFGLADLHRGNPASDDDCWHAAIDYIKAKNEAYAVLVGDLLDVAIKTSKGDIYGQKMTPQDQRDSVITDLTPIKHKILGATDGNHEGRIYELTGVDLTRDIAKALDCPYDPDGLLLRLSFGDRYERIKGRPFRYWIHASHGYGGARTKGAKAVKVERLAQYVLADVAMMAHDHEANLAPHEMLIPDDSHHKQGEDERGFVKAHRTLLVKCSAFLKWTGYARRKGFGPSSLISPAVLLGGEEKPWPMPNRNRKLLPEVRGVL